MNQVVITAVITFLLCGCSDPKQASKSNFKVAAQEYLDKVYPKCLIVTEFPTTIDWNLGGEREKLRAFAKAGLVMESTVNREKTNFLGKKTTAKATQYDLTAEGRKFYIKTPLQLAGNKPRQGICIGKARLIEVTQFTEPADMMGHRVSMVSYSYEVTDLPGWINSSEILKAIPELKLEADSKNTPIKKSDQLVLTSNGWKHPYVNFLNQQPR